MLMVLLVILVIATTAAERREQDVNSVCTYRFYTPIFPAAIKRHRERLAMVISLPPEGVVSRPALFIFLKGGREVFTT